MAASAMTVMLFPSCDKDDDGGSAGGFDVHVPSFVKGTTPIRVDLGVSCDKAPTVTFATEGDALGVVSPVENPEFDTDYVYAGEPLRSGISPLHRATMPLPSRSTIRKTVRPRPARTARY